MTNEKWDAVGRLVTEAMALLDQAEDLVRYEDGEMAECGCDDPTCMYRKHTTAGDEFLASLTKVWEAKRGLPDYMWE
jgi:hypothetical protein